MSGRLSTSRRSLLQRLMAVGTLAVPARPLAARDPRTSGPESQATPAADDPRWQTVFAMQDWYRAQPGAERIVRGRLLAEPADAFGSGSQRTMHYRLGDRAVYSGGQRLQVLDAAVGRHVVLRGKAVDLELAGTVSREIWPAAILLGPP